MKLGKDSDDYKKLSREILKAMIEVLEIEKERLVGNYANEDDGAYKDILKPPVSSQLEQGKKLSEAISATSSVNLSGSTSFQMIAPDSIAALVNALIGARQVKLSL